MESQRGRFWEPGRSGRYGLIHGVTEQRLSGNATIKADVGANMAARRKALRLSKGAGRRPAPGAPDGRQLAARPRGIVALVACQLLATLSHADGVHETPIAKPLSPAWAAKVDGHAV